MGPTLYDRIGGADAVEAAVERFYEKVWLDARLGRYFDDVDRDRLKAHQRSFLGAALGGPEASSGVSMRDAHRGLGITDDSYDRVVSHLVETLGELGVETAVIREAVALLTPLRAEIVER